ncbi:GntR family transcriptional regulator [Stella humosa]|uniref:GntR family transcriptional regulator n=1 Tax=Stella humosa TaxID=94 RepID=A0A3N1L7V7_9PROT|nr:GntR family transcriptional regulator [Stella humosa]ROP90753.1 GntR family transcriptional regulator [Stella humosa]BBK34902.1 GntR family transcriptional regulator [Stella humosa]
MSPVPKPIPYRLAEQIRHGIITGRYRPGAALREQGLEAEYGASRGPVREALRLLELRGLTVHEPRRGFRVRSYSPEAIEQIYRLRALLERHSVESLAGRDLEPLVSALEQSNRRMRDHFRRRDLEAYLHENNVFHRLILDFGGNEPLRRPLDMLNEMAEPIRWALLAEKLTRSRSVAEHERITRFLAEGRLFDAARVTEAHILDKLPAAQAALAENCRQ